MPELSVCVTTLNNANTLDACLASVQFADDLIVLDSGSDDDTVAIAERHGARIESRIFDDYSSHKQAAIDLAAHRWVLLLDADEALLPDARREIQQLLSTEPSNAGYRLPRVEQMFWTFQKRGTRANTYLRLFDRTRGAMNQSAVHAAPEVRGEVGTLAGGFVHRGEPSIEVKVAKINAYSSGMVDEKIGQGTRFVRTRMIFYPPFAFVRSYIFKRQFVNGWAGFISSVVIAFYAFLKYAKVYERRRNRTQSDK